MVHWLTSRNDGSTKGSTEGHTGSTEGGLVLFVAPDLFNFGSFAVKPRCFCQSDTISITLLEENVYYTENFICSSLFATKVHEKYVYQRKRNFLCLLLLICGDVEKCPGPTESNIQDLFNQKGYSSEYMKSFS